MRLLICIFNFKLNIQAIINIVIRLLHVWYLIVVVSTLKWDAWTRINSIESIHYTQPRYRSIDVYVPTID